MIYNFYKQRGETPLECLERFKISEKATYMGRLDPLAEGVLLVASGEDIKRKNDFLDLDKEYDFIALFGFATDTYDVMGKILKTENVSKLSENDIRKVASIYEGEREQKYPEYSSKVISKRKKETSPLTPLLDTGEGKHISSDDGSPVSLLLPSPASRGRVTRSEGDEVKKITIYKLQFHKLETLNGKELFGRLLMDIGRVRGNFRQAEILEKWKEILLDRDSKTAEFPPLNVRGGLGGSYLLGKFSAHVSSGTYIRSLVNYMGETLGCGATTLSIRRTRVGNFKIEDSIR